MRMVVSPGPEMEGILHMPAGQSGHPMSPHYRDGHAAWLEGRPTPFLAGEAVNVLTLVPTTEERTGRAISPRWRRWILNQGDPVMTRIRSYAVALIGALVLASLAWAQSTGVAPGKVGAADDPVLKTIRESVKPTDEQMEKIVELYGRFRSDQLRALRSAAVQGRDRNERRLGDGAEPTPEERARMRAEMRKRMAEAIEPVNAKFLADCRAVLDEPRHEAWDAFAGEVDLMKRGTGRPQREEVRWMDPKRGPQVGDAAPDFELPDLKGEKHSLKSMRGKPVVIEFGSYTNSNFRQRAEPLRELRASYGDEVHWVVIYTFEAHASDGTWVSSRNVREGIEIPQHTSMEDRVKCAKLAKEKLELSLPVLLDDFENSAAKAYSGHPNRGYVIDAEGKISARQVWIDVRKTKRALDKLLGRKPAPRRGLHEPPADPG